MFSSLPTSLARGGARILAANRGVGPGGGGGGVLWSGSAGNGRMIMNPSIVGSTTEDLASLLLQCPQYQQQQIRYRSNRSRRGLYDGKDVRTGNMRSHSMKATKRKFKPNVFKKRLYSDTLDEMIRFHVTTTALRSIDKAGGLDNYLLNSKYVTEGEGLVAKKRILAKMRYIEKYGGSNDNQNNENDVEREPEKDDPMQTAEEIA